MIEQELLLSDGLLTDSVVDDELAVCCRRYWNPLEQCKDILLERGFSEGEMVFLHDYVAGLMRRGFINGHRPSTLAAGLCYWVSCSNGLLLRQDVVAGVFGTTAVSLRGCLSRLRGVLPD